MAASRSGGPCRHDGKTINDSSAPTPAPFTVCKSRMECETQRANDAFCDGHAERLDPETPQSINDP